MRFALNDVYPNIQKAAHELPIGTPASRIKFGMHLSKFKGRGPNFYQNVEYDPNEHDIDQIQWHLTDPDGKVYVREAIIDKDYQVVVMADLSTSMMFGMRYPYKLRLLFETIGNIGLTCVHAQDPMGFIGFAGNIIFDERPRVGEGPVYYLLDEMYKFFYGLEQDGKGPLKREGTDFKKAFDFFSLRYAGKNPFLIVISDFVGMEEFVDTQLLKDISSENEIVFLFLDDPDEFNVRSWLSCVFGITFGYLRIRNIETGKRSTVSIRKWRKMGKEIRQKRKVMRERLKDAGIDSMVLEYTEQGKHFERLYRFFLGRRGLLKDRTKVIQQ